MRLSCLSLPFAAVLASAGYYENIPNTLKEKIEGPPHGWLRQGPPPSPDHQIKLHIALTQPHIPILEKHLWEVSDPRHERYGAHLSKEETEALMAPHPETIDAVDKWLTMHGIKKEQLYRSSAQDWVAVHVPVSLAEKMLNTKYDVYVHSDSGESIIRTTNYSLPESLHEYIEFVQPTTMFSRPKPLRSTLHWSLATPADASSSPAGMLTGPAGNPVNASCNSTITITCLRQLYNAVRYNTSATNGNKIAITGYVGQYVNNQDLQQFFQLQNPAAHGSNYTFVSINGGLNNQSYAAAGVEANLDSQFAYGLTYPTPATFYSTGGSPPYIPDTFTQTDSNEPYLDWLDYMLSQEHPPQTISTSYGDDEQTVPTDYAKRVCWGFAALGVRGVSLFFGTGDNGVAGGTNLASQQCLDNNGTNKTMFIPAFPASCPYVTSVGGTHFIPEIAIDLSGGGFSNYFPRPPYQNATVSKYLQMLPPEKYGGLYNPYGRGYPDVAAHARRFLVVLQGQTHYIAGTSCAAPTFAAFVSMLNDARLSAGKPPMGFLNPWLYEKGYAGLNDITEGHNPGCGTEGFNATTGWDPVTGFGTPNFEKLLQLAM